MKIFRDPTFWAALAGGVVVGIMALDGRFGAQVQAVAVSIRDATRFGQTS
jgi:hypothetical protein